MTSPTQALSPTNTTAQVPFFQTRNGHAVKAVAAAVGAVAFGALAAYTGFKAVMLSMFTVAAIASVGGIPVGLVSGAFALSYGAGSVASVYVASLLVKKAIVEFNAM